MVARPARSRRGRAASISEAFRVARDERLRRAGWEPGTPFPLPDAQGFDAPDTFDVSGRASDFGPDFSTEFN